MFNNTKVSKLISFKNHFNNYIIIDVEILDYRKGTHSSMRDLTNISGTYL
jgi:hypothetical protein